MKNFLPFSLFESVAVPHDIHVVITGEMVNIDSYIILVLDYNTKNLSHNIRSRNVKKVINEKDKIIAFIFYNNIDKKQQYYSFFRNENEADQYAIVHEGNVFSVPLNISGHWNGFVNKQDEN